MPPAWSWPFDDFIKQWFEDVRERREARYGGGGNDEGAGGMVDNEFVQ